jgi:hypothetical protein
VGGEEDEWEPEEAQPSAPVRWGLQRSLGAGASQSLALNAASQLRSMPLKFDDEDAPPYGSLFD